MKKNYFTTIFKSFKLIWISAFLLCANLSFSQTHVYDTLCTGLSYTLPGGNVVNTGGNYIDTLLNIGGNDSVIIITHLSYTNSFYSSQNVTICSGTSYSLPGGNIVTASGTYLDTIKSVGGCDSIITTNLAVVNTIATVVNAGICNGQSYTLPDGFVVTLPGVYIDTLTAIGGCDSVITTVLTIYPISVFTLTIIICDSIANSYQYVDTLTAANGCDSIVYTVVNFIPPLNLTASGGIPTLTGTTTVPNAYFSWSGPCIVSGAYTASPTIGCGGTYTVMIIDLSTGCTKTATVVVPVGVEEYSTLDASKIYPNPSNGIFNFADIEKGSSIEIYDIAGRIIFKTVVNHSIQQVDISDKDKGVYFFRIVLPNGLMQQGKVVVQ